MPVPQPPRSSSILRTAVPGAPSGTGGGAPSRALRERFLARLLPSPAAVDDSGADPGHGGQPGGVDDPGAGPGQGGQPGGVDEWLTDWDAWELDPDCGPPDGDEAWVRLLPADLLAEYCDEVARAAAPETLQAGFWDRIAGSGAGFACGGAADRLAPGPVLAQLTARAWESGPGSLRDDELVGLVRAGRRMASWAAALELGAAAELVQRRFAEEDAGQSGVGAHVTDEIAATLTLTARSADRLADQAMGLARMPLTRAALAAGDIDLPRAGVIIDETACLDPEHARAVEQVIIAAAPGQTSGQLRATVRRAVIAADPAAAQRCKEQALERMRVERWNERAGTTALAGRDLPTAQTLAADRYLTGLASQLQQAGHTATLDALRAQVFLALLAGRDPLTIPAPAATSAGTHLPGTQVPGTPDTATTPGTGTAGPGTGSAGTGTAGPGTGSAGSGSVGSGSAGSGSAGTAGTSGQGIHPAGGVAGVINLTVPLLTWLGLSHSPADVPGYGPLDTSDARDLTAILASHPATRWCLTLTGPDGHPVAHGCARHGPPPPLPNGPQAATGPGTGTPRGPTTATTAAPAGPDPPPARAALSWLADVHPGPLAGTTCDHTYQTASYRPPPRLTHLLHIRHTTCTFPGCRRPATRCDLDHTLAWDHGGPTCECNLAPLCRRHHRAKQTAGWHLDQPQPGILTWTLPSGRSYTVRPTTYPGE